MPDILRREVHYCLRPRIGAREIHDLWRCGECGLAWELYDPEGYSGWYPVTERRVRKVLKKYAGSDDTRKAGGGMERMTCPGCGHEVYNDPMDGWRNDSDGFTCEPPRTTHSEHIVKGSNHD